MQMRNVNVTFCVFSLRPLGTYLYVYVITIIYLLALSGSYKAQTLPKINNVVSKQPLHDKLQASTSHLHIWHSQG